MTKVRARSNKPWFDTFRLALRGMKPNAQTVGLWLAEQADENGIVEAVDWGRLMADTSLSENTCRKELREGGELIDSGRVMRSVRQVGNVFLPTVYHLNTTPDEA